MLETWSIFVRLECASFEKRDDGSFEFIGECFMHRFMNGEAIDLLDQGKREVGSFELKSEHTQKQSRATQPWGVKRHSIFCRSCISILVLNNLLFLFSSAKCLPSVIIGLNKELGPRNCREKGVQGLAYHLPPTGYLVFRDERM